MRSAKASMFVTLVGLGLVGCNPSSFNSLLDKVPVVSFTPPGSSTGSLFVLPLPVPSEAGVAARMLVSRRDTDFLGVADFDMNGKVALHEASAADKNKLGLAGTTSVYSAAVRADGMILLGMPRSGGGETPAGGVSSLTIAPDGMGGYSFNIAGVASGGPLVPRYGMSVAAGNVTGAATGNFVVVGDTTVQVLDLATTQKVAAKTPDNCGIVNLGNTTGDYYAFRPVAVGDLLTGGFDEVVVSGQGRVIILKWDGVDKLVCESAKILSPGALSFGTSLAVADFDGDGSQDLAVGTPQDTVYVYFGPLDNVTAPSVTITNSSLTGFGQRIASYRLPGTASAQLMVSEPAGTAVGGRQGGGRVLIFNITRTFAAMTDANAVLTLFDSNPDATPGFFGQNLGGLQFNPGACVAGAPTQLVPWASTNIDVLTFFAYPGSADPRCFALKP